MGAVITGLARQLTGSRQVWPSLAVRFGASLGRIGTLRRGLGLGRDCGDLGRCGVRLCLYSSGFGITTVPSLVQVHRNLSEPMLLASDPPSLATLSLNDAMVQTT